MPDVTRTFIALEVSRDVVASLNRLRRRIEPETPGARWVDPKQYHFTLAFLGDVENGDLVEVCRALNEAVAGASPFELRVGRLETFPDPGRPRTLWAGVEGPGVEPLRELQRAVAQAVTQAGYRPDEREMFHPHLTLARFQGRPGRHRPTPADAPDLTSLVRRHERWSAGSFRVVEVVAFSSVLRPEGPEYAALSRARLKGRKNES